MRRIGMALAIVAMMSGPVATAQTAYAAQSSNGTNVYTQPEVPRVHMLDCIGTTGRMGCGPGWIWRDGWRGWACYPC